MSRLLWICFGSAVGGGARYLLSGWMADVFGVAFPYGTLAVNVLGSFLIAGIMYAGLDEAVLSPTLRLALSAGVLGGFTTYSSFSYETMKAFQEGAWGVGIANLLGTIFGCLLACVLGWASARWLLRA